MEKNYRSFWFTDKAQCLKSMLKIANCKIKFLYSHSFLLKLETVYKVILCEDYMANSVLARWALKPVVHMCVYV